MYTSTTPTLTFILPIQANEIDQLYITIWQDVNKTESVTIEKTLDDVISVKNKLYLKLSLEDTNQLIPFKEAHVQLQCHITSSDSWVSSECLQIKVEKSHKKLVT